MDEGRFSRNEALFGAEGQRRIAATTVAIVGLGGLGSHVAQQLAYLGVADYGLVDHDVVTLSSMNRLVGAVDTDVAAETTKVAVAERMIRGVSSDAAVRTTTAKIGAEGTHALIEAADVVFGCLDRGLPRLTLTELCARAAKPYFDLASDTGLDDGEPTFGGRVVFCSGSRCLFCLGVLSQEEMALEGMGVEQLDAHARIYGVDRAALEGTGPSVVSVNGTVASLAVTEFMAFVTGLREPAAHIKYFGEKWMIRRSIDTPLPNCPYCTEMWGQGFDLH
jgi:molybdopterin-synthase adenylyltransferase